VHHFANPLVDVLNYPRKEEPMLENGTSDKAFKPKSLLAQKSIDDISEKKIDEDVHHFANPLTDVLNWPRKETAYDNNGTGEKAFKPQSLSQWSTPALTQTQQTMDQL
jgi:hypothetical protein